MNRSMTPAQRQAKQRSKCRDAGGAVLTLMLSAAAQKALRDFAMEHGYSLSDAANSLLTQMKDRHDHYQNSNLL